MSRTAWTDSTQRVAPILLRHGVAGFIPPCLPSPAERPPSGPCCESGRTYSKPALQRFPAAVEQLVYILAPPSDLPLAAIMAHCIPMSASAICSRNFLTRRSLRLSVVVLRFREGSGCTSL